MPRIFTTSFQFNHQQYLALVRVIHTNDELNFSIKLLDTELQQLIPDGSLSYTGIDGFRQLANQANPMEQSLLHSMGKAIEQHFNQYPQAAPNHH